MSRHWSKVFCLSDDKCKGNRILFLQCRVCFKLGSCKMWQVSKRSESWTYRTFPACLLINDCIQNVYICGSIWFVTWFHYNQVVDLPTLFKFFTLLLSKITKNFAWSRVSGHGSRSAIARFNNEWHFAR